MSDKSISDNIQGDGLKVAVVAAKFNKFITSRLLDGARVAFKDHGVNEKDIKVVWVPGSFEIPLAAKILADSRDFDTIVCLGAVIKAHNRFLARHLSEHGSSHPLPGLSSHLCARPPGAGTLGPAGLQLCHQFPRLQGPESARHQGQAGRQASFVAGRFLYRRRRL